MTVSGAFCEVGIGAFRLAGRKLQCGLGKILGSPWAPSGPRLQHSRRVLFLWTGCVPPKVTREETYRNQEAFGVMVMGHQGGYSWPTQGRE